MFLGGEVRYGLLRHVPKLGQVFGMSATLERQSQKEAFAIKRLVSGHLKAQLIRRDTSRASLARELATSRSAVDRVLDPQNTSITLRTLIRAATKLGYKVQLTLQPRIDKIEAIPSPEKIKNQILKLGAALDRLSAR